MITSGNSSATQSSAVEIDPSVVASDFVKGTYKTTLRVTCYGSSSSATPERYLQEARSLGYILGKRNHICVNGAGQYGCMAALNDGAVAGNGHLVGVIHEMFLVDNGDHVDGASYMNKKNDDDDIRRDGSAHYAFDVDKATNDSSSSSNPSTQRDGPIREILVAGGDDLQERKRLLVKNADALVVLPGGPGTWDELWEMACSRHLGLIKLPIVCINVDGYYDPFVEILQRAYEDKLVKATPDEIVHFCSTSEEAVRWIEDQKEATEKGSSKSKTPVLKRRMTSFRRGSFYSFPFSSDGEEGPNGLVNLVSVVGLAFAAGFAVGIATSRRR